LGHPLAGEPVDGNFYLSEAEARAARRHMVDTFAGLLLADRLIIMFEDVPPSLIDPLQSKFFLGEA